MSAQSLYFGKYQRQVTILCLMLYQLLIVPWGLINLYALFTLDWNLLTIIMAICIIQYPFKRSQSFIRFVKKYIRPTTYFKKFIRINEQPINPNEKTMYGYHPHSIFSYSILLNMNHDDEKIPNFVGLGSRFGFNAPILGMILRLWGCSTVYNQNLKSLMQQGQNIGLVPGGYEEASLTTTKQMRLYLKKRKGFIKYALRYGYTIRPVICIGQNKAFQTFDSFNCIKLFLNRFKIPTVFFLNYKYLFFVDPNIEITTIVGKGIKRQISQINQEPTAEQIQKYHEMYVQQVTRIYNKYKSLNENKPLVIM